MPPPNQDTGSPPFRGAAAIMRTFMWTVGT